MLYRLFQYIFAGIGALIAAFATLFVMAAFLGQALDSIRGAWSIIPVAGELALVLAVGICAFRSALK